MKEKHKVRVVVRLDIEPREFHVEEYIRGKWENICITTEPEIAKGVKEDVLRELREKTD